MKGLIDKELSALSLRQLLIYHKAKKAFLA